MSFFTVSNLSNIYSICSCKMIFLHNFVFNIYHGLKEFHMKQTAILNFAIDFSIGNKSRRNKNAFSFDIFKKKNKDVLFHMKTQVERLKSG